MTGWADVARAGEIEEGGCRVVVVDDVPIAVFHIGGDYYAIADLCTHDGGELASGEVEDDEVICPRHGARFCIRTGEVRTPPAYEDVATFPVRVEGGIVQVRGPSRD